MSVRASRQSVSLTTAAAGTTVATWLPLNNGDQVSELVAYLRTQAAVAGDDATVVVELFACASRPANVTEARGGDAIIPAETLSMEPSLSEPLVAALSSFGLELRLPIRYRATADRRFLVLVVTPTVAVNGFAFLGVTPTQ